MSKGDWRNFLGSWTASPSCIGVDFGEDRVHWVQVERKGEAVRLRDACSIKHGGDLEALLSSRTDLKTLVGEMQGHGRFKGRKIVTQAPSEHLRLMVLNYSSDQAKTQPRQILDLARERMGSDLLEHVVDFVQIRTSGDQQGDRSALVAVSLEEPIIEHLERLRGAGLEVTALEIAPVAICRLVANTIIQGDRIEKSRIALVLRIGKTSSELTLLSGRRLLLYREIEIGMEMLIDALTKGLDCDVDAAQDLIVSYGVGGHAMDDSRALEFAATTDELSSMDDIAATIREILRPSLRILVEQAHKAISYAAFQTRGMSIDKIFLMQGMRACPGLDGLLAEMLQLPVEQFKPFDKIVEAERVVSSGSDQRLGVALGFALRGMIDV